MVSANVSQVIFELLGVFVVLMYLHLEDAHPDLSIYSVNVDLQLNVDSMNIGVVLDAPALTVIIKLMENVCLFNLL
jgi:hypothetical protein